MLRQDDAVKSFLVLECFRQGSDFGHQPALMVMGCLSNRVKLGWGSWIEVIQKIPKFSSTIEQPNRDKWPDLWSPEFIKLLHAVDAVYEGSCPDPSMGGLYWANLKGGLKGVTNPWFVEKILKSAAHTACCNQSAFTCFR